MKKHYKNIILTGFFSLLILGFIVGSNLYSRPQYSVMRSMGTKCTSCHINSNYGGQRNFAGWLASSSIGIVDPSSIGLGGAWDAMANTNSIWDDRIMFGADIRFQNAKWATSAGLNQGRDEQGALLEKPDFERKFMTMQLMPYVKIQATDWLSFDASYNVGYDIHDDMRYASQQPYYASARISISEELPSLRIGYFSPSIGVDYDDHTLLVRQIAGAGRSTPLITPDYAELGAELNYDGIEWLNASFGVFESKNADPNFVHTNSLSTVSNISFHPSLPYGLNTYFGVSNYFNGKLRNDDGMYFARDYLNITSFYFNIGLSDRLALMTEYITSNKVLAQADPYREINNYLVELDYQFLEGLNVFARYEVGNTLIDGKEYNVNQYVFGTHIFLLPFIDILPEYRIYDRGDISDYSSQWAIQLHLFY